MIARALIGAALIAPSAAFAAPAPRTAAEFASLPALGKLVEGGVEKGQRFQTYVVGKKQSSKGAIEIYIGQVHMRTQSVSGGAPSLRKWTYAARCSGDANTIGVHTQSIAPREKAQTYFSVYPGVKPEPIDRMWTNVWYAVCLDETEKYPVPKED